MTLHGDVEMDVDIENAKLIPPEQQNEVDELKRMIQEIKRAQIAQEEFNSVRKGMPLWPQPKSSPPDNNQSPWDDDKDDEDFFKKIAGE
jgi:hypothetical protein